MKFSSCSTTCVILVHLVAFLAIAFGNPLVGRAMAVQYSVFDLGTLGGTTSSGQAINESGQVVGSASTAQVTQRGVVQRAFVYDGTMHDIGTLGGTQASHANGINDFGQIVGDANLPGDLDTHAFLYDGTMHDIGTLGGTGSTGFAINSAGQVAGNSFTLGNAIVHAFRYDGTMHDLGTLGGTRSTGYGINSNNQVVGVSLTTGNAHQHAFLYDVSMHDLGTLGGSDSVARAVNDSGIVTGGASTAGNTATHAFFYDGTMHDIGSLGGSVSEGIDINAFGQIVGGSRVNNPSTEMHAFLYDPANGIVDLNALIAPTSGWLLEGATSINDRGQITGSGIIGGAQHAFLLTPVPEPSAGLLFALGAATLWIRRSWQRRCAE